MGITTTARTEMRDSRQKANSNLNQINAGITEATGQEYLLVCIIDDYHDFHTVRRPDSEKTSSGANSVYNSY